MKLPVSPQQPHLVPGYRLDGRYELVCPMAQGGMATVWLARVRGGLGFEKLYGVKTILPHLARDDAFRAMFLDEARIASRIRHPNVAALEDLGEDQGTLYMVLEWIQGDSLARLWDAARKRERAIPLNILLRIMAGAAAGLHAAHELRADDGSLLGVVHRDVSPQNILLTTGGVTKVIDFGIAKARDRLAETTRAGLLKGKAEYSSPEQVRQKSVDRRADVWALGTILYHYVAGHLPYEGRDDLAVLQALASGKPPHALPASVPANVASLIATAMTHDKHARFATARDLEHAIEECITASTTVADVATFLQDNLGSRLEKRRVEMFEAIAEADRRAGAVRGRLASVPELAPFETAEAAAARPLEPPTQPSRTIVSVEVPLRLVHWIVMVFAVLVTLSVWAAILYVLLGPRGHA